MPQLERRDRHELGIADFFVAHLASEGITLTNSQKGDEAAGEPDVVCQLNGDDRGIEIVDCWYSNSDAELTWGLVRDLEERGIRRTVASTSDFPDDFLRHPSGDQLIAICQKRLDDHGSRRYGIPTWLVLNASHAPLHHAGNGGFVVGWLKKPTPWYYLDAYVCLARNWEEGRRFFRVP